MERMGRVIRLVQVRESIRFVKGNTGVLETRGLTLF